MKAMLSTLALLFMTITLSAQVSAVQFMGIPVDGTKSEMISKLQAKGFTRVPGASDLFEGEFNGTDVWLSFVTNKNKIWRICVIDKIKISEASIKIRYNTVYRQFLNNSKYVYAGGDSELSEKIEIQYEMLVNKKSFQSLFFQLPPLLAEARSQYLDQEPTATFGMFVSQLPSYLSNLDSDKATQFINELSEFSEGIVNNKVSISIIRYLSDQYALAIYYDNGYNEASGEDL